jgi:hypothetical protein
MPRNMSFSLTTDAVRERRKTVTRRVGWNFLQPGDVLNACVKCMGLKPGEKIERLALIRVVSVRAEQLRDIRDQGLAEVRREGFDNMTASEFVQMFCDHSGCTTDTVINRIEFEYVDT